MPYDPDKTKWTIDEHDAAENADRLYELIHDAAADGFQTTDLMALTAALGPSHRLYSYLFGGERGHLPQKLIALGVMLERDNSWLNQADGQP